MLYVCIPAFNEAATVGVLLWRIRTVFQDAARDYEIVVYDDGSTDATAEVLAPYARTLPLTILRGEARRGSGAAVEALCRHVAGLTRYPRRDAIVLMQGDFTDRAEDLPELVRRFEGGADLVLGRRPSAPEQPTGERRLRRLASWVLRPFVTVEDVDDLVTSYRLVRVSVLRDVLRERGDAALLPTSGWAATVEFAMAVAPFARRIEMLDLPGRYDVRPRPSRLDWVGELRALGTHAWRTRGRRVRAGERTAARTGTGAPPPRERTRPTDGVPPAPPAPSIVTALPDGTAPTPAEGTATRRIGGAAPAPPRRQRQPAHDRSAHDRSAHDRSVHDREVLDLEVSAGEDAAAPPRRSRRSARKRSDAVPLAPDASAGLGRGASEPHASVLGIEAPTAAGEPVAPRALVGSDDDGRRMDAELPVDAECSVDAERSVDASDTTDAGDGEGAEVLPGDPARRTRRRRRRRRGRGTGSQDGSEDVRTDAGDGAGDDVTADARSPDRPAPDDLTTREVTP